MKNIEVELRAFFNKKEYLRVQKILTTTAKKLGRDNRWSVFYITKDGMVKVTDYISKNTAKISHKVGKIGETNGLEESEVVISRKDIPIMVKVFDSMAIDHSQIVKQLRENFILDDVEIALKHTESWGYHIELEQIVHEEKDKKQAEENIKAVAKKLGVTLLTVKQMSDFIKKHRMKEKRR